MKKINRLLLYLRILTIVCGVGISAVCWILKWIEASAAFLFLTAAVFFSYLPLYIKGRKINKNQHGIEIVRGVFFKRYTFVPNMPSVVRIETATPLTRLLGLKIIKIRFPKGSAVYIE